MDFVTTIEKVLGKEAEKQFMPMQPGDVSETYADVQDLVDNLDYKPETSLDFGVSKFVEWYREFYKV
jgi:UDP-glucuronate 4-epimerase